jgi:hypothetical protein
MIVHEVAECNKTGEAVFSVEVVHVPGAETSGGGRSVGHEAHERSVMHRPLWDIDGRT